MPGLTISARHIHVSLRDEEGKSIFAVSDSELKTGRANAQYEDIKFLSQEGEWFLAGILEGLPDGMSMIMICGTFLTLMCLTAVMPMVSPFPVPPKHIADLSHVPIACSDHQRIQASRGR